MRRLTNAETIDSIVRNAIAPVAARASEAIARLISDLAARELERKLTRTGRTVIPAARRLARRRHGISEITRWAADTRARRVPTFVIEATGLDTKKKIVAKFGENAAFERGKRLPSVLSSPTKAPTKLEAKVAKAKPPTIRKRAAVP